MTKLKIISIGDIHGKTYWKEVDPNKYDKIVFQGDYVDSYYHKNAEIYANLLDIIQLKKDYSDKVILLLGNHDIQYMFLDEGFGCSGFRPEMASNLNFLFKSNKNLFQIAFQIDNFLWTHAGVSTGWYDKNKNVIEKIGEKFSTKNLADTFNHMLWLKENKILHQVGSCRGGAYSFGGITWADRRETSTDYPEGFHQIVGHTPIDEITKYGDEKGSIRYIDVLGRVAFLEEEAKKIEKKWGKNTAYDDTIRALYPDIAANIPDFFESDEKKPEIQMTKFYEFEI